jgi:hypothetical protein
MAKIPLHQEKPAEEINMELRKAKKTMKDIRKNHKEYREDHLKRKAAAIDEDKGKDPNKTSTLIQLIQLIRHEENIQMWRTGKRHMGREIGRGLTEIMVPVNPNEIPTNETKEWRRESDLNKVTLAMLKQNERHFEQSWNTPSATGDLANKVGPDGMSNTAKDIMNGTFEIEDEIPEVMEFIKTFKRKDNIEPLDQTITPEKFKAAFKRVHEKKASSASGRHIGHYKAATTNDTICEIHATMMNMAFKYGTAPERWCTVIYIVAIKEGKVPRQHRTRIIQKLEADANQGLLIAFTRPITHHIDKHEMHHQSQLADKQQQCTTAVLQKTLQCEYA